ncbi:MULTISPECIES: restriction endonuclease subunit S [Enterobacterales]|uniref:restriction endonuclease subunit S n=1 Tax=Enterobacterales TaxID=91347 RepID=UPI0001F06F36|nr:MULTISPECIES: restriction endonuclease subunit S [Enterobacterales]EFV39269.1 hypothetical protein HMPREF0864_03338 [Enterobacteriaceae bacterium 9_2_54FAA]MDU1191524.1 restriction endonuclease subunit S [Enterobacteriaceae bacterium]MBU2674197.1 restriction endonuclease subunit S [Hafnia paralvei]MDU1242922.1 restriction endonuclease subunit S [Enterobacteriaceae bacterium]MEC5374490.1 restriction endonuclease subunit S [Pseudocitrobacter sp. MW920760]
MMVPKLRFSEFSGEWENDLFGRIVTNKSSKYNPSTESKDLPCLEMDSISQEDGRILHIYSAKQQVSIKNKFSAGDVLFGKLRPYLKKYILAPFDGACSSEIWVLNGLTINNSFLFCYIQTKKFIEAANKSSGSKMPRADWSVISSEMMFFPLKEEQNKIAEFLSSVDEKIMLLNKQYDLLCQYKKGMMQKIFSQELRFKDDNENSFPQWSILQLKDIAIRVTRKNKENNNTILTISGKDGLVDQMTYFNKQIASKNVTGYFLIKKGEFAYNKSYSQGYPMGAIKMLSNYEKGVVSTLYICFKLNDEQSCGFYQHYFESGLQNRAIEKVAQEGARNHGLLNIGVNDFFDIELQVPSLAEQDKIAHFLSAIEDKIAIKRAELDMLKNWKQGLLQQMFV